MEFFSVIILSKFSTQSQSHANVVVGYRHQVKYEEREPRRAKVPKLEPFLVQERESDNYSLLYSQTHTIGIPGMIVSSPRSIYSVISLSQ